MHQQLKLFSYSKYVKTISVLLWHSKNVSKQGSEFHQISLNFLLQYFSLPYWAVEKKNRVSEPESVVLFTYAFLVGVY